MTFPRSYDLALILYLVDGLDVIGPDVLVLQVVGVLPDVDAEEGHEARRGLKGVLVGASSDLEPAGGLVVPEKENKEFLLTH